jgi:hypothetical protein
LGMLDGYGGWVMGYGLIAASFEGRSLDSWFVNLLVWCSGCEFLAGRDLVCAACGLCGSSLELAILGTCMYVRLYVVIPFAGCFGAQIRASDSGCKTECV